MNVDKITVCGGGNGAQTLVPIAAGNLGCLVDIYAPFADETARLRAGIAAHGGFEVTGMASSKAIPRRVSPDPAQVIPGSEVVVLVLPAFAHEPTLRQIAPHLKEGAWVGAMPARGGFDYSAFQVLSRVGRDDVRLFGLQTLPWACRVENYGQVVHVLGVKEAVDVASRPTGGIVEIAPLLEQMLGMPIGRVGNFLALTLANTGQLIHPGIMYGLFAGWDGKPLAKAPLFYQGLSTEGAAVLAALSNEVQAIRTRLAPLLDLSAVRPLLAWLLYAYGDAIADPSTLHSAFVSNWAYAGLEAPVQQIGPDQVVPDFQARYMAEDVPYGLAVSRAIADLAGVETPMMDRVIAWAGQKLGKDYVGRGAADKLTTEARVPQRYGLQDLKALIDFATEKIRLGE
jgi:hypothetical protein